LKFIACTRNNVIHQEFRIPGRRLVIEDPATVDREASASALNELIEEAVR
jgi:hypothetical protein